MDASARTVEQSSKAKGPYKIAISRDELALLVRHREATGEPLQTTVRRLIRETVGVS